MSRPLVIVGDTLLDIDLVGRAERLSPDAPVPVVSEPVSRPRPGGAGLAALMAAHDGSEVVLVTALADDEAADQLRALLRGVRVVALSRAGATPVKQRIQAQGQTLLRLDTGGGGAVGPMTPEAAEALRSAAAILVADYGTGTVDAAGVREELTRLAPGTPIVWDPHPRGGPPVPGVRLVTPNDKEAALFASALAAPRPSSPAAADGQLASARRHADVLLEHWRAHGVAVTLGARGALLSFGAGTPSVAPAPQVTCVDPCGAGDRFAVTAATSLGSGRLPGEAVQDAVEAAAAYVAAGGPASLTGGGDPPTSAPQPGETARERVRREGGVIVATGGCFDLLHAGHVATLRAARRLGDHLVVCLNSDESVRRLKGPSRPLVSVEDRARVLRALEPVDEVVVFDEDTPVEVLRRIRPAIWAKGGDYAGSEVPEAAVLEEWGGQAVALPYLEGRSTTALVELALSQGQRPPQTAMTGGTR
ncbi:MAG TPA: D-glycero-beta-D-manno-heptose 1-phosphate adenylyltransferase [Propionibacteriaceae bacterium]|nr:D-glycero-beta-D-manno-heptose 1-phosphate adenylyltransferase [Propionibacteriaceae bacterium]